MTTGVKILVDCDVLLDVLLKREPFFPASAGVLTWAELHPGRAAIAWHTLSVLAYLSKEDPRPFLEGLLSVLRVAQVGHEQAEKALHFPMKDFEDALQTSAALAFGASHVVTRNEKDYRGSPVPAIAPKSFMLTYAN